MSTTNDPQAEYKKQEPMLSDAEMIRIAEASPQHPIVASVKKIDQIALAASYGGAFDARDRYESLISSGDLIRRDELVEWLEQYNSPGVVRLILDHINTPKP